MAGALDKFFEKDAIVREVIGAETFYRIKSVHQLCFGVTELHTDTAATGGAFQHYWVADACGFCFCFAQVSQKLSAWKKRNVGLLC